MRKLLSLFFGIVVSYHSAQSGENWFENTLDPKLLIQHVQSYCEEQINYHKHMKNVFADYQGRSPQEKKKFLWEGYGVEYVANNSQSFFTIGVGDHIKWEAQFQKTLNNIEKIILEKGELNAIWFIKNWFSSGKEFYLGEKKATLQNFAQGAKKFKQVTQGSCFLKEHTLKTYEDFISDYNRFQTQAEKILLYVDRLNRSDDLFMLETTNPCDIFVRFGECDSYMSMNNYLNLMSLLFSKEIVEEERQQYVIRKAELEEKVAEDLRISGMNEQKAAEVVEEPLPEIVEVNKEDVKEPDTKSFSQTVSLSEGLTAVPLVASQPVGKKSASPKPPKKLTRVQAQKQARKQNTQIIINKKQAAAAQQSTVPTVDKIPFRNILGAQEKATLEGILTYQRNISWEDFENLITSKKGFNGAVYGNRGGSYRSVVFKDPVTQKPVSFIVHQPHKPGQGSSVLYFDFMKRVKHHLENQGVINQ